MEAGVRTDSISTLPKGSTYAVRFDHYDRSASVFVYANRRGAQANVRTAKIARGQTSVAQNDVLGVNAQKDTKVRVDLPLAGGDGRDPYLFVDCTAGTVRVEVISTGPFDSQVRG